MENILHSKIVGEGKPLLILHGFFGMGDNWKSLANKFAEENFEVHLVDQRNHGRSFHSEEFNYDPLVEDLYKYIQHHNLDKIDLLGHSMGGKTVMLFATKYPEVIDKLMVALQKTGRGSSFAPKKRERSLKMAMKYNGMGEIIA